MKKKKKKKRKNKRLKVRVGGREEEKTLEAALQGADGGQNISERGETAGAKKSQGTICTGLCLQLIKS